MTYSKIENEQQYKEYCNQLDRLLAIQNEFKNQYSPFRAPALQIQIELLTALIEQYQDYQDIRRMYRELIIRSQCALPTRPGEIEQFDQGIRPEDAHKVLGWIMEDDEKNPLDL